MLIYRQLKPLEYCMIPTEALDGFKLPEDNSLVMAAITETGEIVAVWCAIAVVHLEPLWIHKGYRKSNRLLLRLWQSFRQALMLQGVKKTMTVIADAVPVTAKIANWCGAEPIQGRLYMLDINKATV